MRLAFIVWSRRSRASTVGCKCAWPSKLSKDKRNIALLAPAQDGLQMGQDRARILSLKNIAAYAQPGRALANRIASQSEELFIRHQLAAREVDGGVLARVLQNGRQLVRRSR